MRLPKRWRRGRGDRRDSGGRNAAAARGDARHGGTDEAGVGGHRRGDRPGRVHRNQPADQHRRADLRPQGSDALLRAQLHGGPGTIGVGGGGAGDAAVPADDRETRRGRRRSRNVPNWRAACTRCAGGGHDAGLPVADHARGCGAGGVAQRAARLRAQRLRGARGTGEGADAARSGTGGRGGAPHGDHGDRRLHPSGVRRPLPPQRPVHRRQCAQGGTGRARGLHADLPQRNRGTVHFEGHRDRCVPVAVHAARPLRVHEPGAEHRRFADRGAVRAPRNRGDQRAVPAHAGRYVPPCEPRGRVCGDLAPAERISETRR